jgi:hypothetical protein
MLKARALDETLGAAAAIGGLHEHVGHAAAPVAEDQTRAIKIPARIHVLPRIQREALQELPPDVPDPDVTIRPADVERDTRPVRRESWIEVVVWWRADFLLATVPIRPDQRALLRLAVGRTVD